jgi:hypothetical protein
MKAFWFYFLLSFMGSDERNVLVFPIPIAYYIESPDLPDAGVFITLGPGILSFSPEVSRAL